MVSHLPDANGAVRVARRLVETDEGPRPDSSAESLAKLRPVFAARGSVTAGNSSQMSDGAAAVILVSDRILREFNLQPLARFVSFAVAGVPPRSWASGRWPRSRRCWSAAASRRCAGLDRTERSLRRAIAGGDARTQARPAKVNPLGGAIALGHPLGATGAIRTATLVHGLRRTGGKHGLVTMCIGTGMGAAGLFEALWDGGYPVKPYWFKRLSPNGARG